MRTIPNLLSFLRIPLALLFLQSNAEWRLFAVIAALISDGLDGYLARKYGTISKFGTLLDPITDKFFALMALSVFIYEQRIEFLQALFMLARDIAICFFGCYVVAKGNLRKYQIRSLMTGKITTALQFFVFCGILCNIPIPTYLYTLFIFLGVCTFIELCMSKYEIHRA